MDGQTAGWEGSIQEGEGVRGRVKTGKGSTLDSLFNTCLNTKLLKSLITEYVIISCLLMCPVHRKSSKSEQRKANLYLRTTDGYEIPVTRPHCNQEKKRDV